MEIGPISRTDTRTLAASLGTRLEALPGSRSIAEIHLSDAEYRLLERWGSRLAANYVHSAVRSFARDSELNASRIEQFGLVLMALIAEVGRRKARDGEIWSTTRAALSDSVVYELFNSQGQPNEFMKDALELAARRWNLRHAFDEGDTQAWYVTAYLQFGLTRTGIQTRLPHWLAGWVPLGRGISVLLNDPDRKSESFAGTWSALRSYRAHNMTEHTVRPVLAGSPWILEEWHEDVLREARAKPELGWTAPDDVEGFTADTGDPGFLTVPAFRWNGAKPEFEVEIVGLAEVVDLRPDRTYQIQFDDARAPVLLPVTENGLGSLEPQRLSVWPSETTAKLVEFREDGRESLVAEDHVVLWDPRDEVAAFENNGRPFDAYRHEMSVKREYTLLLAPGLNLLPEAKGAYSESGCTAIRLSPDWNPDIRVVLGGHTIWVPLLGRSPDTDTQIACVNPAEIRPQDPIHLKVSSDRGLPTRLSVDGRPASHEWTKFGPVWIGAAFGDEPVRPSATVTATFDDGGPPVRRWVPLPCRIVDVSSAGHWEPIPGEGESARAENLEGKRVRVVLRGVGSTETQTGYMFLGSRMLRRCGAQGAYLRSVTAHGERLEIRRDPFLPDPPDIVGAGFVWSGGIVRSASLSSNAWGLWTIDLDGYGEWNQGAHSLWIIGQNGSPAQVESGVIKSLTGTTIVVQANGLETPAAVVVCYRNTIVGQKWLRWPRNLNHDDGLSAARFLRVARSAGIPMAAPGSFRKGVQGCARHSPECLVGEWMLPPRRNGLPWKRSPSDQSSWYAAVREALFDWIPNQGAIEGVGILDADTNSNRAQVSEALRLLSEEFPVQAHALLHAPYYAGDLARFRDMIDTTRLEGVQESTLNALSEDRSISVDSHFIERLPRDCVDIATGASKPEFAWRIRAALNLSPLVRQFVGASVLKEFA